MHQGRIIQSRSKESILDEIKTISKDKDFKGKETWGVVELGYRLPDEQLKLQGKIKLTNFENFCPYEIDLDYYKDVRSEFTISEWIDIILGAIDYNASGYEDEHQKLAMINRFFLN